VAMAVLALDDDVADVNAHANIDPAIVVDARVTFGHFALEEDRARDSIAHAPESGREAVAHQLEDAAVMTGDFRPEKLPAVSAQPFERGRLVLFHESAVADHIGGKDGGQSAFHGLGLRTPG